MTCEFILSGISNEEVKHENGYDIFEPTLVLKIDGKNVFRSLGLDGVKNCNHALQRGENTGDSQIDPRHHKQVRGDMQILADRNWVRFSPAEPRS